MPMHHPNSYFLNTYPTPPLCFVRGEGALLFDEDGRRYIDLLAGIAVTNLGHAHPAIAEALASQARTLVHVSNLFASPPAQALAQKLQDISGHGFRSFFANSGAEANESAIKLVRKWAGSARHTILCAEGGFHGRTLASLAATGQPGKWKGFEPLPPGFRHAEYNNLSAFEAALDDSVCAILVEPIQGERGVLPATKEFLQGLRSLCDKRKIALILDEVQTGIGRTGSWWAFQQYGIVPDVFTSAKALGNGLPIGACLARDEWAEVFQPGDHGCTFGGGLLQCTAALATLETIEREGILSHVQKKGERFQNLLRKLPLVQEVRGLGLHIGVVFEKALARELQAKALTHGLIVNASSEDTLRIAPPLIIEDELIDEAVEILRRTCASL